MHYLEALRRDDLDTRRAVDVAGGPEANLPAGFQFEPLWPENLLVPFVACQHPDSIRDVEIRLGVLLTRFNLLAGDLKRVPEKHRSETPRYLCPVNRGFGMRFPKERKHPYVIKMTVGSEKGVNVAFCNRRGGNLAALALNGAAVKSDAPTFF